MPNRLIDELSPYLLQHAHNPVDWYPWGDEPFERAKREHKPVIVSIGYAACHWCHVMEHESFEDAVTAAYMNEHFVCIKVDREEHPAVDHMYMDAVQAITGSGGWPLNVFVTPDRLPFYGGTYFPPKPLYGRSSWMQILERMHEIWTSRQDEVAQQSTQMLQYLQNASKVGTAGAGKQWDAATCKEMAENLLKQADKELGGFGKAPKFPGTMAIGYLLQHYVLTADEPSLQHAVKSLDAMLDGGIYDQIGGGLARYATDDKWLIPHFEKMLYDNALLVSVLCDAYAVTKNNRYKAAIDEIIAFVERELKDATGGYYSALDADSEGVEGKYYTWTWEEWQELIGSDEILMSYFGVSEEGNWEHTNILHVAQPAENIAMRMCLGSIDVLNHVAAAKKKLFEAREKRIRPLTDDKSLLSWNALMNIALSKAAMVLANDAYASRALEHMDWMHTNFRKEGEWHHTWKAGQARIAANLEDYAYLLQAMLQLASATGRNEYIVQASDLLQAIHGDFINEEQTFFYYSSVLQKDIPVRKTDIYDGALPSANAVMAHNLLLLGLCMDNAAWLEQAYAMLLRIAGTAHRYTYSFSYWATLLQQYTIGYKTAVCTGGQASYLHQRLLPALYIITSQKEISDIPLLKNKFEWSQDSIFICTTDSCLPPTRLAADVLKYLQVLK
ncbi:MAG: thioredoxin domain-containing protein [Flavipsychrobacter sp.]